MKDPKERDSEHVLDVVHIDLLPIDSGYTAWEDNLKKNTSRLPKPDKKFSFFAGSGLDCLEDEDKLFFGFGNRAKQFKHKQFVEQESLISLKAEIIAETVDIIAKFKDEMDTNFADFRLNMSKEFARRQKHQYKKIEKLLREQKNLTEKRACLDSGINLLGETSCSKVD